MPLENINPQYLDVAVNCTPEIQEIIAVMMMERGFEGTWEIESGVRAYILKEDLDEQDLYKWISEYGIKKEDIQITPLADINWNEDWEKSYEPIFVKDRCYIHAEFHEEKPEAEYRILIQPKMSFGTGHHDTTYLMVSQMLDMNFEGKNVLDIGCGTGVLAILAAQKGAGKVTAFDNNPWSFENTVENAARNNVDIEIKLADIESFTGKGFDILLANINRNINHDNMEKYAQLLNKRGILLMSGYFSHDFDYVHREAIKHGLVMLNKEVSDKGWVAVSYQL